MIFAIIIIAALGAIAFFHYLQGFLSATLSAIFTVIASVVAVSYHEMVVEKLLGVTLGEWGPPVVMLGMFALTYLVLRVIFDKMIPGQISIPAMVDKVGGGIMGVVAGAFATGTVAIAAQQLPFGPSLGGYTRYETHGTRTAILPQEGQKRAKDIATFDEIVGDTFDKERGEKLLLPVDDFVVGTVAHLSDGGSLGTGKPLASVHPDYLQELFGQRLGIESVGGRTLANLPKKGRVVDVVGVYKAPNSKTTDGEFPALRDSKKPVKYAEPTKDEMRVVVRVTFTSAAGDKDRRIRLSPANVRLVAKRLPDDGSSAEPVPHNYYPIGTLDPSGYLYFHKIDDPLYIEATATRVDGSTGAAEVDFVFQVKQAGFLAPGEEKNPAPQIAAGTFIEAKKLGRVELEGDKAIVKEKMNRPTALAVRRKNLHWEKGPEPGPAPLKAGTAAAPTGPAAMSGAPGAAAPGAAPGAPAPAAPAAPAGAQLAPDEAKSRMIGTWSAATGLTYAFRLDGTYTGSQTTAGKPVKSADGKWKVLKVEAGIVELELIGPSGKPNTQRWSFGADANKMTRETPAPATPFERKS